MIAAIQPRPRFGPLRWSGNVQPVSGRDEQAIIATLQVIPAIVDDAESWTVANPEAPNAEASR